MASLRQIYFAIIENGFQPNHSDELKDNIRLVNFMAVFFLLGNLSEILWTHGTVYVLGSAMSIAWNIVVLVLLRLKYHLVARIVFSAFMIPLFYWMGIYVMPSETEWQLTIQFIISSFVIIPFMIFGVNERRYLYPIISIYLLTLIIYPFVHQWVDYPKPPNQLMFPAQGAPPIIASMMLVAFVYYQRLIRRAHQKIAHFLDLTREKNEELNQQKEEIITQRDALEEASLQLQKQHDDIKAGITYAQRIQRATLPEMTLINKFLPENFIFFRPRDIVSGDFYWCQEKDEKILLVVADCTGHGVPGAFMSMIGSALLDKITTEMGITSPDLVLTHLHLNIRKSLHQATGENRDGMDLAFCAIDTKQKTVEFAGAKNPLVYVRNGQVTRLKGDRFPIGGRQMEKNRIFKKHLIKVQPHTTFYLFSDGFQDQFGGDNDKKFMSKRFRNLLGEISSKDMTSQKNILDQELNNWIRGLYSQTDDILVMGFRI